MPTLTPHYSLYTYDSTTDEFRGFQEFRSNLAGLTADSSMIKIDTALHNMQSTITGLETLSTIIKVSAIFDSGINYIATVTSFSTYTADTIISLSLDITNTGAVSLNINSLGYKSLYKTNVAGNLVDFVAGDLIIGKEYLFRYNGTAWVFVSAPISEDISIQGTAGNIVSINPTNNTLHDSGASSTAEYAPSTANFIVGEIDAGLSNEISIPSAKANPSGSNNSNYNGQDGGWPLWSTPMAQITRYDFETSHPFSYYSPFTSTSTLYAGVDKIKSYYYTYSIYNNDPLLTYAYITIPTLTSGQPFDIRLGNCSIGGSGRPSCIAGLFIAESDFSLANGIAIRRDWDSFSYPSQLTAYQKTMSGYSAVNITAYPNSWPSRFGMMYHYTAPMTLRINREAGDGNYVRYSYAYDGINFGTTWFWSKSGSATNISKIGIIYTASWLNDGSIPMFTYTSNDIGVFQADYLSLSF